MVLLRLPTRSRQGGLRILVSSRVAREVALLVLLLPSQNKLHLSVGVLPDLHLLGLLLITHSIAGLAAGSQATSLSLGQPDDLGLSRLRLFLVFLRQLLLLALGSGT